MATSRQRPERIIYPTADRCVSTDLFVHSWVTLFVASRRPLAGRRETLGRHGGWGARAAVREATRPGVGTEGAHTLSVTPTPACLQDAHRASPGAAHGYNDDARLPRARTIGL